MQEQQADMFKTDEFIDYNILTYEEMSTIDGCVNFATSGLLDDIVEDDTSEPVPKLEQPEIIVPHSPLGPPKMENFAGKFNFAVEIKASETDKSKYLYSAILNRIYVDREVNFPMHFTWDVNMSNMLWNQEQNLYVRATVVFSEESQAEKRVERCLQHAHGLDVGNESIAKHVLLSTRALGTSGIKYCGLADRLDSWLSVLVQFSEPGVHAYQFVCKNSCSSGINRRSIAIIFTLEDEFGFVLGRQSVGARVCACPRRDLKRDEAELNKSKGKRKSIQAPPDTHKKIKIEVIDNDDKVITLPKLQIKGVKTAVTGLEVMQRMMELSESEARKRNDQKSLDEYRNCLTILNSTIDSLKKSM